MQMILRYPSGRLVDGILLAAGLERMRIVVRRVNETMELRLENGHWVSEKGDRIEVECWLSDGRPGTAEFCSRFGLRTATATR
ncbi:MAG: hypothetical protein LAQ69_20025 [Acidobacteriia bacterium]|nr:hypothetical protein [Terriglobia bacterium]